MTGDDELISRYVGGDEGAFSEIVDLYERRVYAIAVRMCGEPEDARDVVQEVFVSAMRALRSFRADAKLSTWLHRVAVNASLDVIRRRKRRAARPIEEIEEHASADPGPEQRAIAAARAAEVQAALGHLSEDHRAVLVLNDLQDLDYAEVSEVLGIPIGTVKSRIHRARIEIARLLGHLRDPDTEGEPHEAPRPLKDGS